MPDLESPASFAARAVESPEDLAKRMSTYRWSPEAQRKLAETFCARDAAVRREALAEAARWLAQKVADVREVTRDCRREAIALKAAGKDWQDAFQRECLSASRCGGFADAEAHFRALATGGTDG